MSRLNMDPLLTFHDGSHLVMSTQCSKEGSFSCALYTVLISADDGAAYRIISSHLEAQTCMRAQAIAYEHALHLYPQRSSPRISYGTDPVHNLLSLAQRCVLLIRERTDTSKLLSLRRASQER